MSVASFLHHLHKNVGKIWFTKSEHIEHPSSYRDLYCDFYI